MRILIDMDGVCADMLGGLLPLFNRYYGTNFKSSDITDWKITDCTGLSEEQFYSFLHEPGFFRHLPVIPGAVEAISLLHEAGHEIIFVTACAIGHEDKLAWIGRHFPQFKEGHWVHNMVFATRKELIIGDILLDDGVHNLEAFEKEQNTLAVCFDQPYNQKWNGPRVKNWEEFLDLVLKLDEGLKEKELACA